MTVSVYFISTHAVHKRKALPKWKSLPAFFIQLHRFVQISYNQSVVCIYIKLEITMHCFQNF
jgi:hypothetical protein